MFSLKGLSLFGVLGFFLWIVV